MKRCNKPAVLDCAGGRRYHPRMGTRQQHYAKLAADLATLLGGERDFFANAANFSSFIFHALPDLNWAGFYVRRDEELVLGPFQGKPARVRIPVGKGVCGASAARRETIVVEDVREFPGHIACDGASRSEIVVPLLVDGDVVGVLDLDSPTPARFDHEDEAGIEKLVGVFLQKTSIAGIAG